MPNIIACPNCQGHIKNDPAIAGQVVSCPHCNRQITMPQSVRAVRVAPSPAGEFNFASQSPSRSGTATSKYRRSKKKTPLPWILGGSLVAIVLMGVVIGALANKGKPTSMPSRAENKSNTGPKRVPKDTAAPVASAQNRKPPTYEAKLTLDAFLQIKLGDPEVDVIARLRKDYKVEHESEMKVDLKEARKLGLPLKVTWAIKLLIWQDQNRSITIMLKTEDKGLKPFLVTNKSQIGLD